MDFEGSVWRGDAWIYKLTWRQLPAQCCVKVLCHCGRSKITGSRSDQVWVKNCPGLCEESSYPACVVSAKSKNSQGLDYTGVSNWPQRGN